MKDIRFSKCPIVSSIWPFYTTWVYFYTLQENCRASSDCKTIVPKGKQDVKCPDWKGQDGTIGNMHRLSVRDVEKINNYYACNVIKLPERGELLLWFSQINIWLSLLPRLPADWMVFLESSRWLRERIQNQDNSDPSQPWQEAVSLGQKPDQKR